MPAVLCVLVSPIVYGLVAAFIAYNAVALITNGINGIMALAEGVKAAALMMSTGATFAATAAQYGLNAALLACPITWIVVLVIALVAATYAACSAIAKFTGIANSGFGVICGGINVVVQFFVNLGLTIANIALGIWNALGACAQNIGHRLWQCHCRGAILVLQPALHGPHRGGWYLRGLEQAALCGV